MELTYVLKFCTFTKLQQANNSLTSSAKPIMKNLILLAIAVLSLFYVSTPSICQYIDNQSLNKLNVIQYFV